MNYIVFDLEWNQSIYGRSGEHPRIPFEIIEIGAVKVNEKCEIIDEYVSLIKPKVYRKLNNNIREMLNYDEEELMKKGIPFREACKEFLKWCGTDYVFCTWGPSDLYYLQNNMDFYYMEKLPFPVKYFDVQTIYAEMFAEDRSNVCKLEKAVKALEMDMSEPFHAAINDARYTARVMAKIMPEKFLEMYTYDIYRHPRKPAETIEDFHNGEMDYISIEYPDKKKAMEDKNSTVVKCCKCKRKCARKIDWFQKSQTSLMAVGKCFYHGYVCSKIKFKQSGISDERVFVIKKSNMITKAEMEEIKSKQTELKFKKKEKLKNSGKK